MISKYDKLIEVKNDIENYLKLLNNSKKLPCENYIKCIAKYIIFFKNLSEYSSHEHYKNCMIYDSLILMHSLTQNSVRNFYQSYRSFIENFIRSVLNLGDDDETGVRNLFNNINKKFSSSSEIINFVNGEYSKACQYVHSNVKANVNVYMYYVDILKNDEMDDVKLKSFIEKILTLMKKVTTFIVYEFPTVVDTVFNRRNQELEFLIGRSNYSVFKSSLNEYVS